MNREDILTLVKAGFTKEEIQAMSAPAEQPAADQETPAQPAAPETPAEPEAPEHPAGYDDVLEALNRLTDGLVRHNINQTIVQPAQRSVDDALAEIIAPPMKKKLGGQ